MRDIKWSFDWSQCARLISVCQMCQGASQVKCFSTWISQPSLRSTRTPHAVLGPVQPTAAWSRGSGYSQESYEWGAETLAKPQTSAPPLHSSSPPFLQAGPCGCQWDCEVGWEGKSSQRFRWEVSQIIASWFLTIVPALLSPGSLVTSPDHRQPVGENQSCWATLNLHLDTH